MPTTFPDPAVLKSLVEHYRKKALGPLSPEDELLVLSGVSMNWIADYMTDENVRWDRTDLNVDNLYLTGTNPEWNKIIIDECHRSPIELRARLKQQPELGASFSTAAYDPLPILVRHEEKKFKVLDGMHRTIGAILAGRATISAYVCTTIGPSRPHCEPHVIYDLLRAYHRKINPDRAGLVAALRFIRKSYANAEDLLRKRFTKAWVPDDEIQSIIEEALKD